MMNGWNREKTAIPEDYYNVSGVFVVVSVIFIRRLLTYYATVIVEGVSLVPQDTVKIAGFRWSNSKR